MSALKNLRESVRLFRSDSRAESVLAALVLVLTLAPFALTWYKMNQKR